MAFVALRSCCKVSAQPLSKYQSTLLRAFSASRAIANEASAVHTSYPYLNVHSVTLKDEAPAPNLKYALSYVSSKDIPSGKSIFDHPKLVIGWTPEQFSVNPRTFVGNDEFVHFLNEVLAENIHNIDDSSLKGLAKWQKEGWLHVADERNPPAWGRIPSPEDIIGSVLVKDGVIQPGTYQPMPAHRLVTANGIFQLSEPLKQCVIKNCKKDLAK
ncbi:hypothetical protein DFQ28_009280 [Apophysomyces sp. BC1034]|nr:hypothetical protein DFQ28_009280 [Apophysomyces sp. BC1034]